jgi:desulfoferrodoxin (superoxide reductase-like protein)
MTTENFIVDNNGKRIAVMLPIKKYNQMLEALEALEDIKAYDISKSKHEPVIELNEAIKKRKLKKNAKV